MKGIFIAWGSAPALAIATILILNVLSTGMHMERGEEVAVGIDEEEEKGIGPPEGVGQDQGQIQEPEQAQEKTGGDVAGIASAPEGGRMLVEEPSMQMAPVREVKEQEQEAEQYIMLTLPYITSAVAASISFIIVRRFVYK